MSQNGISNNICEEKNEHNEINNNNNKIELKNGEFLLTPIETLLINKKMPFGYKLDIENNILKSKEISKTNNTKKKTENHHSKQKKILDIEDYADNGRKYLRERKIQKEKMNKQIESQNQILEKCEKCLEIIISNFLSQYFYNPITMNSPSLSQIEKNIKNAKYTSHYDFFMDLRKIWLYYYQNYPNNPEIYQRTCKMSELSEELCKNIDNLENAFQKELNELKIHHPEKNIADNRNNGTNQRRYNNNNNNNSINYMSIEEKNALGNAIRKLNKEQLKGIIKLLSDSKINQSQNGSTKYIEFDIDKLPYKKLKELQKYVKDCTKHIQSNNINNNNNDTNNSTNYTNNNNNINNNNNDNNKIEQEQIRKLKNELSDYNMNNNILENEMKNPQKIINNQNDITQQLKEEQNITNPILPPSSSSDSSIESIST